MKTEKHGHFMQDNAMAYTANKSMNALAEVLDTE
jgi:hypothetical protein